MLLTRLKRNTIGEAEDENTREVCSQSSETKPTNRVSQIPKMRSKSWFVRLKHFILKKKRHHSSPNYKRDTWKYKETPATLVMAMVDTNQLSLPHNNVVEAKENIDYRLQTTELKQPTGTICITVEEPTGQVKEVVLALQRPLIAQNSVLYDIVTDGELSISGELQITSSADWRNAMDILIKDDEDAENNRPLLIVTANCQASDSALSRDTTSLIMSTELQRFISSTDTLLYPEASTLMPPSLLISKPRVQKIVPKVSFHIKTEFEPARNVNNMLKRTRSETSLIEQMSSIGPFNAGFSVYDVTLRRSLPTQAVECLPNHNHIHTDTICECDGSSKNVISERSFIRRGTYGNVVWPLKTHQAETHEMTARKPTLCEYIKRKPMIDYLKKSSGTQTTNEMSTEQDNPPCGQYDLNKSGDYAEMEIGVTGPRQEPISELVQEKRKISETERMSHRYYATNIMNACCPRYLNGYKEWECDNEECLNDNMDEGNEKREKSGTQNKTRSFNKNLNANWECIQHFYNEKWHKSVWTSNSGRKSRSCNAEADFEYSRNTLGERPFVLRCICGKAVWPLKTHEPQEYKANATIKKCISPNTSGSNKSEVKPSLSDYLKRNVTQGVNQMRNQGEKNSTFRKQSGARTLDRNFDVEILDNPQSNDSDYFLCQLNKEKRKHLQINDNEVKHYDNGYKSIYFTKCSGDSNKWRQANVGLSVKKKQIEGNHMGHKFSSEQIAEGTNPAPKARNKSTLTNRSSKKNFDSGRAILLNHLDNGLLKQEVCKTVVRGTEFGLPSRNQYGYAYSTASVTNQCIEESMHLSKHFASTELQTETFEDFWDPSKCSPQLFPDLNATLPKIPCLNPIVPCSSGVTFNPPQYHSNNMFLFQSIPKLLSFPQKMNRGRKNKVVIKTILSNKMVPLRIRKGKLFEFLTCVDSENNISDRCSKSHRIQNPKDKKFMSFENVQKKNLNDLSQNDDPGSQTKPFALYYCVSLKPNNSNSNQRCNRKLVNVPQINMSFDKDKVFLKLIKKMTSFSQRTSEKNMIKKEEKQRYRKWCKISEVPPKIGLESRQSSHVVENQVIVILVSPSTYKYKMDFLYLFCTISQLRQKNNNNLEQLPQKMNELVIPKWKLNGSQKQFVTKKTSSILGSKNMLDYVMMKKRMSDIPNTVEKKNGGYGDTFSANEMNMYNSLDFVLPTRQSFVVGSLTGIELNQGAGPNTNDIQHNSSVQAFGYEIVDANRTRYSDFNANFQHVPYNVSAYANPASTQSNLCKTDRPIRDTVQLLLDNEFSDLTHKRNEEIEGRQGNNLTQHPTAPVPNINSDYTGSMHQGILNYIHTRPLGISQCNEVYRKCPEKLHDKTMFNKYVSSIDIKANNIIRNSEKMKYEEPQLKYEEPTLEKHQSRKSRETKHGFVCTSKSIFSNFSTSIPNNVASRSRNIDLKQTYPNRVENIKPTYSESTSSIKSIQRIINPKSTHNSISQMFNTDSGHRNGQFNWMDHKNKRYMNEIFQDRTVVAKENNSIKSRTDMPMVGNCVSLTLKHRSSNCSIYETGNSSSPVEKKHFSQWNFNENSLNRTNIFDLLHKERLSEKSNKTSRYNRDPFEAKYKLMPQIPRLLGGRRTSKKFESKKSMPRVKGSYDSNSSTQTHTEKDSVYHHSPAQPLSNTTEHHSFHPPKNSKDLSAEERRRHSIKDKLKKIGNKHQREAASFPDETELNVVNYDSTSNDRTKNKYKDQNIYSKHDPKLYYVDQQESKYKPWLEPNELRQNHENIYFSPDKGRPKHKRKEETKYVSRKYLQHSSDSDTSLISSKSVIHLKKSRGSLKKRDRYGNSNNRSRSKGVPALDEIVCRHKVCSDGQNHYNKSNQINRKLDTPSSKRVNLEETIKELGNSAADIILIASASKCDARSNNMKKGISLSEFNVYRMESTKQPTDEHCSSIAANKYQYIITKRNVDNPEGKKQNKYNPDLDNVYMMKQKDTSGHNFRYAKRNESLYDLGEDEGYSADSVSMPQIQRNVTSKKTNEAFKVHREPHLHSHYSDQQRDLKIKKEPQREYSYTHKMSENGNSSMSQTIVSVIDLETGNKDHAKLSKRNNFQSDSKYTHPLLFKHGYTIYKMSESDAPCGVKNSNEQKTKCKNYYDQTKPKVEEKNNLLKRFSRERRNSVSLESDFLHSSGSQKTIDTSPYYSCKPSTKKIICKINKSGSPHRVQQANTNDNRVKNEHAQVLNDKTILARQSSLKKPKSTASLQSYQSHKCDINFCRKSIDSSSINSKNTSLTNLNNIPENNEVTEEDKSTLCKSLSGSKTPLVALKTGQKTICKQGDILYIPVLVVSDNSISEEVTSPLEKVMIPQDNRKIMQMLEKTLNEHPHATSASENIQDIRVEEEGPITVTEENVTKELGTPLVESRENTCVDLSNQNEILQNEEQTLNNVGSEKWSVKTCNEGVFGSQEEKQHEEEYLQQLINSNAKQRENSEDILSQCVEVRNEQGVIRREILQFEPEQEPARSSYYQFKCNDIDCTGNCVTADHRYYHVSIKDPVGSRLEASCDEPRLRVVLDVFNYKEAKSDGHIMYSKINVRQPDECEENYKKYKCSEKDLNEIEMPRANKSCASILNGKGIIPEMKEPNQENKMPNPLPIKNESANGTAVSITPPNYLVLAQTGSVFFHKAKIADSIPNENQLNEQPHLFNSAVYIEPKFEYLPRVESNYCQTPISDGVEQMGNDAATNLTAEGENINFGNVLPDPRWNMQYVAEGRNSELETDAKVNKNHLANNQIINHPKTAIKSVFNRTSVSKPLRGKSKGLKNKAQRRNKYYFTDNTFNKFTSLNDIPKHDAISVHNIDSDKVIDNKYFQSRQINKSYSNDNFHMLSTANKLCSKTDLFSYTNSVTSISSMKKKSNLLDKTQTNQICSTDASDDYSVMSALKPLSSTFPKNYNLPNDIEVQQKKRESSQNIKKSYKCYIEESTQLHNLNGIVNNIEMLLDKTERKCIACEKDDANKCADEAMDDIISLDNSAGSSRSILNSHGSIDMAHIMEEEEKKLCHQWLSNVLQRKYAEQSLSCQLKIDSDFDDSESEDELNECSLEFSANKLCSLQNCDHSACHRSNQLSTRDLADGLRKLCNKTKCTTAEGRKSKSMQMFLENKFQSESVDVLSVPLCPQVESIEPMEKTNGTQIQRPSNKINKTQNSNHCSAATQHAKKTFVHPNSIKKLIKAEDNTAKIETMDRGTVMCKSAIVIPKSVDKLQFRGENNFQVQSLSNGLHDYSNDLNKQEEQDGFIHKVPLRQNCSLVWNNKQRCKKTNENLRNVSSNPTECMDGHQYINSLMGHREENVYSIEVETAKSNSRMQGDTEGRTKGSMNWQAYSDKHLIEMSVHTIPNRRKNGQPY